MLEKDVPKNTPLTPELNNEPEMKSGVTPPSLPPSGGNRFSKNEKLKSKKLIEQLFAKGKSVSNYPIKLIYLKTELPFDVPIQAAVTVPKKNFKSAVKRNRIKRLMRESYRLNKALVFNNSKGAFAFLFLYLGKEMPDYALVEENLKAALHKFKKKIDNE